MFNFFRKTKSEATANGTGKSTPSPNNAPVNEIENITQKPPAEPHPYNTTTMNEINKRINCALKLKPEMSYSLQKINVDREIKRSWKDAEMLGFPSGSEVTEEEFWLAYLKGYAKNVIKKEANKNKILQKSADLDNAAASIDQQIVQLNEVSNFISGVHEKMNNIDTQQQKFIISFLSQIDEKPALIKAENTFILEGKEYPVTPKMKSILLELSKTSGWTTAKRLSELIPESEAYICCTLSRLMNKGYPIISYSSSGKKFWALEKGNKEKESKENAVPENKPDLLLHALHLYKYLNGRPPATSEIASQLKWDITYVKKELGRMNLNGKVKSEKMFINGKRIKVWIAEEK